MDTDFQWFIFCKIHGINSAIFIVSICITMDRKIKKKRFGKKQLIWIIGSVVVLSLIGMAYKISLTKTYHADKDKLTISTVTFGDFEDVVLLNANVDPLTTVLVNSPEGGVVEKIYAEDGSMVTEGQPLIKISNPNVLLGYMSQESSIIQQMNQAKTIRLQLEQDQRKLQQDVVDMDYNLATTQRQFQYDTTLYRKGIIPKKDYEKSVRDYQYNQDKKELAQQIVTQETEKRKVQLEQINMSIGQMQQSLVVIHENIENMTVKAAVAGRLSSFDPVIGRSYGTGETLGKIDMMQGYKLTALVDEYYISRVKEGQKALCTFNNDEYELVVRKVLPEVVKAQFQVELNFTKKTPEGIRRGLSLNVKLTLSDNKKSTLLPLGQFYNTTGGNWVFVLKGNKAVKRNIHIGRKNYLFYEVLDGLQQGDQVITSGYDGWDQYEEIEL